MKTKMIRIAQLVLFIIFLGCAQNESNTSASEELLSKISERFQLNDYVEVADMGFVNPSEQTGQNVAHLFRKIIEHPLNRVIEGSPSTTFGVEDPNRIALAKEITLDVFNSEGFSVSEKQLDDMNSQSNRYQFNSEGMISMLNDAEENKTITALEHEIIKMQLQEVFAAKTKAQVQKINSTVEFEVNNSRLTDNDKQKLLFLNSAIRNVLNGPIPIIAGLSVHPLVLSDEPVFLQTGTYVVVGVIVVASVVGGLINAYTNQNCTAVCQVTATAAGVAWGAIGVAFIFNDGEQVP